MYAVGDRGISLDWFLRGDIRQRVINDPAGKVAIIGARCSGGWNEEGGAS
jgi:hypothetical protein